MPVIYVSDEDLYLYPSEGCAACGSEQLRFVGDVLLCKRCGAVVGLEDEDDDDDDAEGRPAPRQSRQYDDGY